MMTCGSGRPTASTGVTRMLESSGAHTEVRQHSADGRSLGMEIGPGPAAVRRDDRRPGIRRDRHE